MQKTFCAKVESRSSNLTIVINDELDRKFTELITSNSALNSQSENDLAIYFLQNLTNPDYQKFLASALDISCQKATKAIHKFLTNKRQQYNQNNFLTEEIKGLIDEIDLYTPISLFNLGVNLDQKSANLISFNSVNLAEFFQNFDPAISNNLLGYAYQKIKGKIFDQLRQGKLAVLKINPWRELKLLKEPRLTNILNEYIFINAKAQASELTDEEKQQYLLAWQSFSASSEYDPLIKTKANGDREGRYIQPSDGQFQAMLDFYNQNVDHPNQRLDDHKKIIQLLLNIHNFLIHKKLCDRQDRENLADHQWNFRPITNPFFPDQIAETLDPAISNLESKQKIVLTFLHGLSSKSLGGEYNYRTGKIEITNGINIQLAKPVKFTQEDLGDGKILTQDQSNISRWKNSALQTLFQSIFRREANSENLSKLADLLIIYYRENIVYQVFRGAIENIDPKLHQPLCGHLVAKLPPRGHGKCILGYDPENQLPENVRNAKIAINSAILAYFRQTLGDMYREGVEKQLEQTISVLADYYLLKTFYL